MKCKNVKKIISKYFDRSSTLQENNNMFEHFYKCQSCRQEYEIFSKIFSMLPVCKENMVVSANFESKLFAKLRHFENTEKNVLLQYLKKIPVSIPAVIVGLILIISTSLLRDCSYNVRTTETYEIYPSENIDLVMFDFVEIFEKI